MVWSYCVCLDAQHVLMIATADFNLDPSLPCCLQADKSEEGHATWLKG